MTHKEEPVAQYSDIVSDGLLDPRNDLYTAPQKREWVGLTDEEILLVGVATGMNEIAARMIEAKLKEKNT